MELPHLKWVRVDSWLLRPWPNAATHKLLLQAHTVNMSLNHEGYPSLSSESNLQGSNKLSSPQKKLGIAGYECCNVTVHVPENMSFLRTKYSFPLSHLLNLWWCRQRAHIWCISMVILSLSLKETLSNQLDDWTITHPKAKPFSRRSRSNN